MINAAIERQVPVDTTCTHLDLERRPRFQTGVTTLRYGAYQNTPLDVLCILGRSLRSGVWKPTAAANAAPLLASSSAVET